MAGKEPKIATVIIKVDLECCRCSKKIKRTLCKLQKRFEINSIVFDEKKNTVTVSGAFNPDCFIKKIRSMACKVIIEITIPPPPAPPPPPPLPEVVVRFPIWPCSGKLCTCYQSHQGCCCCSSSQPCPRYQPHLGCNRCCSCGHVSSCPPSQPSCSGGYPCYNIVCEDEPSYGCSIM